MLIFNTKEEIEKIAYLYFYENKTLKEVADIFDVCPNTIKRVLKTNFPKDYAVYSKRNYKNLDIDHNFFEKIDTEEKAYILGFLLADGNLYYDTSYRLRFSIAFQDIEILYKIKDILHLQSKVRVRDREERENSQPECYLTWTSEKQFKDLKKYGIIPNKSLTSILPLDIIDSSVVHHFIRGLFDGDGCISVFGNRQSCSFVGTFELIYELKRFFISELGVYDVVISERTKKNTVYQVLWASKKDVLNLYNYMYKDASIYLDRKYQKFQQLI